MLPEALCVNVPCKDTEEFQSKGTCLNTHSVSVEMDLRAREEEMEVV